MTLPQLNTPTFNTTLPSSQKKIEFRPFLVGEEKNLLLASESEDSSQVISEVKSVLKNCIKTEGVEVDQLSYIDLEWMIIQLRAKSKDEVAEFSYKCNNVYTNDEGEEVTCGHVNNIKADLREVYVTNLDKEHQTSFELSDEIGVELDYPSTEQIFEISEKGESIDGISILASLIKKVWSGDQVFTNFTQKEAIDFLNSATENQLNKLSDFLKDLPEIRLDIEFDCGNCGYHHKIQLEGLNDFFG